jgi:hypothetical protein
LFSGVQDQLALLMDRQAKKFVNIGGPQKRIGIHGRYCTSGRIQFIDFRSTRPNTRSDFSRLWIFFLFRSCKMSVINALQTRNILRCPLRQLGSFDLPGM